jgi:hypothetical protein
LTLACNGDLPRRYGWSEAAAAAETPQWSIAVTFREHGGRLCELRASGSDALEAELALATGLTALLKTFGAHFAKHWEQVPGLAVVGENAADAAADPQRQNKAA